MRISDWSSDVCSSDLTIVLISTLLSIKKTAARAESVLAQVEREVRPMASELESLTGELQKLSRNANDNLQRIGGIVDRVEDISVQAARVIGAVGGLTRISPEERRVGKEGCETG